MSERRTALVTGASSGIGAAIARALGALGWPVAIGARRADRLKETAAAIEAAGGEPFAARLDVTDPESIEAFFRAAEAAVGPLDVVVSNAGIGTPGLAHELSVEEIHNDIATNLTGAMIVARRALPSMLERRRGDIVFISSMTVVEPRPFQGAYAAAKAGLEGYARVLRRELEGTGVRATVVRLGPTRSEFGLGWNPEMLLKVVESWKPWGLMRHMEVLDPDDVAAAIVYAVTAPAGFGTDLIEINPDGSSR
jgi:NAD(P)-dependent dehydrogenase (short-subunit alcohol dehydrogenase family)